MVVSILVVPTRTSGLPLRIVRQMRGTEIWVLATLRQAEIHITRPMVSRCVVQKTKIMYNKIMEIWKSITNNE